MLKEPSQQDSPLGEVPAEEKRPQTTATWAQAPSFF